MFFWGAGKKTTPQYWLYADMLIELDQKIVYAIKNN